MNAKHSGFLTWSARLLVLGLLGSPVLADGPAPAKIEVFPADVNLNNARDRQLVVVQATYPDGVTRDVTAEAAVTPADPALLRREGHIFWPVADGKTELTVAFEGQTVKVPVTVTNATLNPPISFRLDVMPVWMRSGCNTGSCHGAARARTGSGSRSSASTPKATTTASPAR